MGLLTTIAVVSPILPIPWPSTPQWGTTRAADSLTRTIPLKVDELNIITAPVTAGAGRARTRVMILHRLLHTGGAGFLWPCCLRLDRLRQLLRGHHGRDLPEPFPYARRNRPAP